MWRHPGTGTVAEGTLRPYYRSNIMNPNLRSSYSSILSLFRHPLALLGGVLLCVAPGPASAQSVTFIGAQTTVFSGGAGAVAVDNSGNLFAINDLGVVVKLPKTATGYG